MTQHPNASAAVGSAWVVAALIWLLGLAGVEVPDPPFEVGLGPGGSAAAVVLLLGREGVRGLLRRLWRGTS